MPKLSRRTSDFQVMRLQMRCQERTSSGLKVPESFGLNLKFAISTEAFYPHFWICTLHI